MATLTVDDWALQKITLDYANQFVPDIIIANANDASGRGIDLYVTKDGTALSMTDMKVYLVWRHENGNQDLTQFTAVSAAAGHYKVYFPNAMMHGGIVLARIAIYIGSKTPITGSRDFRIHVEPNPLNEDEAMADENFTLFQQAVVDLNELEASIEAAESKRVTAENARVSAESARASNENTRKSNETARISAESSRASAESTRASNENTRKSNETSRVSAESSRVTEFATLKKESQDATQAAIDAADYAASVLKLSFGYETVGDIEYLSFIEEE